MCHCAVLVNSYVDSWISCLSDEITGIFPQMLPSAIKDGRYVSLPLLFFPLFICCCYLCLCADLLRRSKNTGFRNALLKIKAFHAVISPLKLMIKDPVWIFFLLLNEWINLLKNFLFVMFPDSEFNSSWSFPAPLKKDLKSKQILNEWKSSFCRELNWWKEWTEAQTLLLTY